MAHGYRLPPFLSIWLSDLQGPHRGSGLENNRAMPEMRGGRMEPGGSPQDTEAEIQARAETLN
jgi:hypothetical protein